MKTNWKSWKILKFENKQSESIKRHIYVCIFVYKVCVWTNMYFKWEKRGLSNFSIDYLLNSIKKNIRLAYKRNIVVIYIDWNIVRFYLLTGSLFPFKIVQIRMKCECVCVCSRACISVGIYEEFKLKWKHQLNGIKLNLIKK